MPRHLGTVTEMSYTQKALQLLLLSPLSEQTAATPRPFVARRGMQGRKGLDVSSVIVWAPNGINEFLYLAEFVDSSLITMAQFLVCPGQLLHDLTVLSPPGQEAVALRSTLTLFPVNGKGQGYRSFCTTPT